MQLSKMVLKKENYRENLSVGEAIFAATDLMHAKEVFGLRFDSFC